MRRVLKIFKPALCALGVCLPAVAGATVLIPIEFRELVAVSSVIVHGRVTDAHPEWTDGRRSVETLVTIGASEYLKGNLGDSFTIHVPGGQLGRYRTVFIGAPEFHPGDEVLLFLRDGRIVGLSQGAFRVVADATGRATVVSPVVMSASLDASEAVVRGDARRKPLALDSFRDLVRQVIAGGAK